MPLALALPSIGYRADAGARAATMRALTGEDEVFMLEDASDWWPAERATALLARCVTRLDGRSPVTRDMVRALSVGECDALVLHLRRMTFGDAIAAIVSCSVPDCRAPLELDLRVSDLLVGPSANGNAFVDVECGANGARRSVRFRPPTAGDLEAIAPDAARSVDAAVTRLLSRCATSAEPATVEWSEHDLAAVARALAAHDPQADLTLQLTCAECGAHMVVPFDVSAFVFREITDAARTIYHDVHLLASRYHWSERDILRMSRRRRRAYVEQVEGGVQR